MASIHFLLDISSTSILFFINSESLKGDVCTTQAASSPRVTTDSQPDSTPTTGMLYTIAPVGMVVLCARSLFLGKKFVIII